MATRQGKHHEGQPFDRAALVRLLSNVLYGGQVRHKGTVYAGEQAAIIPQEIGQQARDLLYLTKGRERMKKGPARKRPVPVSIPVEHGEAVQPVPHPAPGEGLAPEPAGRLPRITRLLALAVRFEGLLQDGTVCDYAELARLGGVSRARITQIMSLRNLAPVIQERILELPASSARGEGVNERLLREVAQCWEG